MRCFSPSLLTVMRWFSMSVCAYASILMSEVHLSLPPFSLKRKGLPVAQLIMVSATLNSDGGVTRASWLVCPAILRSCLGVWLMR